MEESTQLQSMQYQHLIGIFNDLSLWQFRWRQIYCRLSAKLDGFVGVPLDGKLWKRHWSLPLLSVDLWAKCHEPGTTGFLEPPRVPLEPSPLCGSSLSPPPWPRLSYAPRRNILDLANITPGAIFLTTLSRWLADQDQVKRVCTCLVSFSVMFIASRVVSLVVPLLLRVCLAFVCVMFIASLGVSLVVPYRYVSASLLPVLCLLLPLLFPWLFLTIVSLPCVFCCGGKRGRAGSCVSGARRWSHDGKLCVSLVGRTVIPR